MFPEVYFALMSFYFLFMYYCFIFSNFEPCHSSGTWQSTTSATEMPMYCPSWKMRKVSSRSVMVLERDWVKPTYVWVRQTWWCMTSKLTALARFKVWEILQNLLLWLVTKSVIFAFLFTLKDTITINQDLKSAGLKGPAIQVLCQAYVV